MELLWFFCMTLQQYKGLGLTQMAFLEKILYWGKKNGPNMSFISNGCTEFSWFFAWSYSRIKIKAENWVKLFRQNSCLIILRYIDSKVFFKSCGKWYEAYVFCMEHHKGLESLQCLKLTQIVFCMKILFLFF